MKHTQLKVNHDKGYDLMIGVALITCTLLICKIYLVGLIVLFY